MRVAIIADDLTGAADSGVQLAHSGYRTGVAFCNTAVPPAEDLDAVALDTGSRTLPTGCATKRVSEAGRLVREARIVYKKIDSTLRGPIAAELVAALEATRRGKVVVAPAFPSAGRTTRGGVQLVHGEPVHETALAHDPLTPVSESRIPYLLSEAFRSVAALSVTDIRKGYPVRDALESDECVVADAECDADLDALVKAVPDPSALLWVGSAGLARAFGKVYPGPYFGIPFDASDPTLGVLTVVGSINEVAREQLSHLAQEPGMTPVALDTEALITGTRDEAVDQAMEAVRAALSGVRGAVLYSSAREEVGSALRDEAVSEGEISERVVDALAEIVAGISGENLFDALILTGGDTAVRVARELEATGILLWGEIEAGVPVGTLIGPRPYRIVTKAGGFGGPDTLRDAFCTLTETRKDTKA